MRKLLLVAVALSIALFTYPEDVSADCNNLIGVSAKCYTSEGSSQYALWMTFSPTLGTWCPSNSNPTITNCNPGWNCVGGVCGWYATYSQTGIPAGTTWGVTDGTGTRYTSSSSSISVRYQMAGGTSYIYDNSISGGTGTQYVGSCTGSASSGSPTATCSYEKQYYITPNINPAGAGTIVGVPSGGGWAVADNNYAIKASANPGYIFSSWSGDASGSTNPVTITMNGPKTVTANFVLATCNLPWGGTINNGQSITAYESSSVAYGQTCISETRTCNNGALSGSYTYSSCSVQGAASCTFNGQTIPSGGSVTAYQTSTVTYGNTCASETRACSNGALSGSYAYSTCSVGAPPVPYCGDGSCNNGETCSTCPGDCGGCPPPPCSPSCPGGCASVGQSDGCGGTCPDSNGQSCGSTTTCSYASECANIGSQTVYTCGGGSCNGNTQSCGSRNTNGQSCSGGAGFCYSQQCDTTKPSTSAALVPAFPNGENGWYTSDVAVTLSCTDTGSGCASTYYRINGGAWQSGASFTVSAEGTDTLEYYSKDNAGNTEATKTITLKLDKTPPSVPSVGDSPDPVNSSENVTFAPVCQDAASGCNSIDVITSFGSCTAAPAGGKCTSLAPYCAYGTYAYNASAEDIAGFRSTPVEKGTFEVKKADGCSCLASTECITECNENICYKIKDAVVSMNSAGFGNDTRTTIKFGTISRIFIEVENPNPVSKLVPLHVDSQDEIKNWVWFSGHRTDANRRDINMTLAPGEKRTLVIEANGVKAGRYKIFLGPTTDYTKKYLALELSVTHNEGAGLFSTTPDISWATMALTILFGSAALARRRL